MTPPIHSEYIEIIQSRILRDTVESYEQYLNVYSIGVDNIIHVNVSFTPDNLPSVTLAFRPNLDFRYPDNDRSKSRCAEWLRQYCYRLKSTTGFNLSTQT